MTRYRYYVGESEWHSPPQSPEAVRISQGLYLLPRKPPGRGSRAQSQSLIPRVSQLFPPLCGLLRLTELAWGDREEEIFIEERFHKHMAFKAPLPTLTMYACFIFQTHVCFYNTHTNLEDGWRCSLSHTPAALSLTALSFVPSSSAMLASLLLS